MIAKTTDAAVDGRFWRLARALRTNSPVPRYYRDQGSITQTNRKK